MKAFVIVLAVATIVGGLVGAEWTGGGFSATGATIAFLTTFATVIGLGAWFHHREERKSPTLTPEMRAVFGRMLGGERQARSVRRALQTGAKKPLANDPVLIAQLTLAQLEREGAIPGLEFLSAEIRARLLDREKTTASLVEDRLNPRGLVCLLATNVAFEQLASGAHHVYRGTLDFKGQQIRAAFSAASKLMVKYGIHDDEAHRRELTDLEKAIQQVG